MKENIKNELHKHGYKATLARIAILKVFSMERRNCDPMSAEQVFKKLKNKNIDLVTVYRTLASFEEKGLLRRVEMKKDSVYFERAGDHHHHIICTNCEKVSNFENTEDAKLIDRALKQVKDFKQIYDHSFDLFGICNSCAMHV